MLRVRLLGALRLELDGRLLAAVATRQARSLLAWLIVHPGPEVAAHIVADRERVGIERGRGISADLWDTSRLSAASAVRRLDRALVSRTSGQKTDATRVRGCRPGI